MPSKPKVKAKKRKEAAPTPLAESLTDGVISFPRQATIMQQMSNIMDLLLDLSRQVKAAETLRSS